MTIGDWEVTIKKLTEFRTVPGDPESVLQRVFDYEFHHIPSNFRIPRTIQFIEYKADEDIPAFLIPFVDEMKKAFIDPHGPDIQFS